MYVKFTSVCLVAAAVESLPITALSGSRDTVSGGEVVLAGGDAAVGALRHEPPGQSVADRFRVQCCRLGCGLGTVR